MSFTTEATLMWSRDSFGIASDRGLRKTATIKSGYQITCPVGYSVQDVSAVPGLPLTNSSYPGLSDMRLRKKDFTKVGPTYWICIVTYEGTNIDPVQEPPEIEWSDSTSSEAIDEDWDGNPIVNVNNEPLEGVTMDVADLVLSVKRNFRTFSPALQFQYRHSVNSDTFLGFPAGCGRLTKLSGKQQWWQDGAGYWSVSAQIQFRYPYRTTFAKAWYARVRNEGFWVKDEVAGRLVQAIDQAGQPTQRPVLLKEDGTIERNPEAATWLEFKRYQSLPYAALGLL